MQVGDVVTWQKTFTEDEVRLFTQLSGDSGVHHVTADERGRLMVHGLLTATLPTKIGGDLNFIARQLTFHFLRPVYAGDTITCDVTLLEIEPDENYYRVRSGWSCRNQEGREVMTGEARGVVRR